MKYLNKHREYIRKERLRSMKKVVKKILVWCLVTTMVATMTAPIQKVPESKAETNVPENSHIPSALPLDLSSSGYTEVTLDMCKTLNDNIATLAESFAYDTDTSTKLTKYRETYEQYLVWDEAYEKQTTMDQVTNISILAQMEEAYLMITYLEGCYGAIEPFEGLTDYFDVSSEEFHNFKEVSQDSNSDLNKFVGHFTGAAEDVLAFFKKEGTAISDTSDNLELGKTIEAVFLFVQNNETVFEGAVKVNDVIEAAPETTDITKATHTTINPIVEELGTWIEEFDANGSESQKNALDRRVAKITGNLYSTLADFYDAYLVRCLKIGFEKRIDDLYEEIYNTMDYTTISSDNVKIAEVENEYILLPQKVQDSIVNLNMLEALRNRYKENLEYYQKTVVPALEASQLIEDDYWKLYDTEWPRCADIEKNDNDTVERNLVEADTIINHAQKAYMDLTSAQKKHVTTYSYLDYMQKTYEKVNLKYMITSATRFYPMLETEQILDETENVQRVYRWLTDCINDSDYQTLQETLVDEEVEGSDVVSVIGAAAQRVSYLQQNIGTEAEKAIRKLVTMKGNDKGFITKEAIERTYQLYLKAMQYESAKEELTEPSRYEIEALHTLVVMAGNTADAILAAGEVDLSKEENAVDFNKKYEKMVACDESFVAEFAQVKEDFKTLEDGSVACLTDMTYRVMRSYLDEYEAQTARKQILDAYDSIGTMSVMDEPQIKTIHDAYGSYVSIVGEQAEDTLFAGQQLRRYETIANHIETFINLCKQISDVPQTSEERDLIAQATSYYQDTLTEEERSFVPASYIAKLTKVSELDASIAKIIGAIDAISAPVDDVTYQEFLLDYENAQNLYDTYVKSYPEGASWIVNANRLLEYDRANEEIVNIKDLLQLHSSLMVENKENFEKAIESYEDLPTEIQDMVYNYPRLYSLYNDVSQAAAVTESLNGLVVFTLADEPKVAAARKAFDSLSERGKQYVNNSVLLGLAEKQIEALQLNASQSQKENNTGNQEGQQPQQPQQQTTPQLENGSENNKVTSEKSSYVSMKKAKVRKLSKRYKLKNKKKLNKKVKKLKKALVVSVKGKKLKKNKDYTITTKTNKKRTKVTFSLKGKGKYKDTKKVSIKIVYSKKV